MLLNKNHTIQSCGSGDVKEPDGDYDQFTADLKSYYNYYAFGMLQPDRHYTFADEYNFGFQGQELENDEKGFGNSIHFTFRDYDPRTGKMKSPDPLEANYPWNSPYAFQENKLGMGVELEGLELSPSPGTTKQMNIPMYKWFGYYSEQTVQSYEENCKVMLIAQTLITGIAIDVALTKGFITRKMVKNLAAQYLMQSAIQVTASIVDPDDTRGNREIFSDAAKKVDFFDAFVSIGSSDNLLAKGTSMFLAAGVDITPEGFTSVFDGDKEMGDAMWDFFGNVVTDKFNMSVGKYGSVVSATYEYVIGLVNEGVDSNVATQKGIDYASGLIEEENANEE